MPGVAIWNWIAADQSREKALRSPACAKGTMEPTNARRMHLPPDREIIRRHIHAWIEVIAPVSVLAMALKPDNSVPIVG